MKTTNFLMLFLGASLFLTIGFIACKKDNASGTTKFSVKMTDNPFDATEVNVDVQQVLINYDDDSTEWVNLQTHTGVYNLLDLQNNVDTLIAEAIIPTGKIEEIRLVLGSDNTIVFDSVSYPLTIPSGSQSGLKIKVNKELNGSVDSLLIDFDAALSILQTGAGDYKLKPVIKVKG
ncbi:MAG: DUF4382 domain-containing protein [Bacteroidota bacterium]